MNLGIFTKFGELDGNKFRRIFNAELNQQVTDCLNDNVDDEKVKDFSFIVGEFTYIYRLVKECFINY